MEFDKDKSEKYINSLLKEYDITVNSYSKSSCGWADWNKKEVKIPHPTNEDRFGVCLHEIKHIIDGNIGKRYEQEFWCDIYALEGLKKFGYDTSEWGKRMRWHILSRVAMATNRGHKQVNAEILEYFSDVDIKKWYGKKVFVSCDRKFNNLKISIK